MTMTTTPTTPGTVEKWEKTRIRHSHRHKPIENVNKVHTDRLSRGQRVADSLARVMGSWSFIITQSLVLACWITLNVVVYIRHWDPYPFILLNLALSFQAAYAAPIIMMSQNRQAEKDREAAGHDYEVNLKAELEIMSLHEKLDDLRQRQLEAHFARLEERLRAIESRGLSGNQAGGKEPA